LLLVTGVVVTRLERQNAEMRPVTDEAVAYQRQAAAIAEVLARVPPVAERERLLAEVLAAAQRAGLQINGGRYDEARTSGALQRIEATLPATAHADAVLRWLDELGESVPTAVVTRVTLTRGAPGEPLVGDIKLDLYLRSVP
jgi:hypothetical protein